MARVADFRSDTLTQPTDEMRRAMAQAVVGDDVFGEDPTIRQLEERGAEFLGQQAALFVPSGTMGNQIAVHVHCRPGDELICEERSHVFLYEAGSVARLSGTQVRTLRADRGFVKPAELAPAVRADDTHYPRSRLFVLENTHNMAGGVALGPEDHATLVAEARRLGLLVHVDGARLVNAAVAGDCRPADLTAGVDSVSVCLSKGLGSPVGSLLAGSADFVGEARRVRKALGGGMRQAGVLAACGLVSLQRAFEWIPEDHRRAAALASGLGAIAGLEVGAPDTNIVMADMTEGDPKQLVRYLDERGVRALAVGPARLRFVVHHDLEDADVDRCLAALAEWRS